MQLHLILVEIEQPELALPKLVEGSLGRAELAQPAPMREERPPVGRRVHGHRECAQPDRVDDVALLLLQPGEGILHQPQRAAHLLKVLVRLVQLEPVRLVLFDERTADPHVALQCSPSLGRCLPRRSLALLAQDFPKELETSDQPAVDAQLRRELLLGVALSRLLSELLLEPLVARREQMRRHRHPTVHR